MSADPDTKSGPPLNPFGADESPAVSAEFLKEVQSAVKAPFEVTNLVGRGGMAFVFRAWDPPHKRSVAIKVLRPELTQAMAGDRFLREIEITAQLQHPHIVSLYDSGSSNGLLYYVMPFVEGESLRQLIEREERLSIERSVQIIREILGALAYAHARGAVHRDIKPENVLLSSGLAVLADFGIARAVEQFSNEDTLTEHGIVLGTPEYMSPEQCTGKSAVDARSDIYSIGCTLYELLAGEPPFIGRTRQAVIAKQIGAEPTPIRVVRPNTPKRLAKVIERSLAKVPGDRYQNAEQMLEAVEAAVREPHGVPMLPVALSALGLIAAGLWLIFGATAPGLDTNKVAVFPLEERGLAVNEQGAGGNVAVMISTALEHADPLRPLDVQDRLTTAQREDPGLLSPTERKAIAQDVRAAFYIAGFVQAHGDSTTVGVRLYDTAGDSLIDQQSASALRVTPIHHMGIDAVKRILPALVDPGREIDLAPLRDRGASAMALFIQGEKEYRHSRFSEALAFYERAIAEDSAMAIAGIKGALAANWIAHHVSNRLAEYAAARISLLPPRYAAFARGLAAFTEGQADTAEAWLLTALSGAPQWPEASMQLGEVYYHLVPNVPSLDSLAVAMFETSISFDSAFSPPLFHLAESAVRDGDIANARELITRYNATNPPQNLVAHLELMMSCVAEGGGSFDWARYVTASPDVAFRSAKALAVGGYHLACAESGFRRQLAFGSDTYRWGAILGLQSVLAAQGRSAELITFLDSVVAAGDDAVAMTAYIVDAIAGLPVTEQAAAVAEFGQDRWGESYGDLADSRNLDWLQWLFGVWHAYTGEREIVERLARDLTSANQREHRASTDLYARALQAHARLLAGDTTQAIRMLQQLSPAVPSDSLESAFGLPLAVERLKLAELLLARNEPFEALHVASVFDHQGPLIYVVFLPASLSLRIEAATALGWRNQATELRARLAALGNEQFVRATP